MKGKRSDDSRYRGVRTFDPSITQDVIEALHQAGREDIADRLITEGMRDLEVYTRAAVKALQDRCTALEQERIEFVKATGVNRILEEHARTRLWKAAQWLGRLLLKGIEKWGVHLLYAGLLLGLGKIVFVGLTK